MKGRLNNRVRDMDIIPVIGSIKVGGKSDKGFPVSYDYFHVSTNIKEYKEIFEGVYGDKPNKINIVFMDDDVSKVCSESRELRDKDSKVFCLTDNEVYTIFMEGKQEKRTVKEALDKFGSIEAFEAELVKISGSRNGFRRKLTLKFIIHTMRGVFGSWVLNTYGDKTSIDQIITTFDGVMKMAGRIKMIPFDLIIEKKKSKTSGITKNYPVISLVANIGADNLNKLREFNSDSGAILNEDTIMKLSSGE